MATEKLQVRKVPIEISIPNPTLDAWIQRGLGGPDPAPHPPKKSHVLWVSIEISIPHPPKKSHVLWVSIEISIHHPPKKSHVLWASIEISIPRHPKINKNTVTPHLVRRNAARYNYFLEFECSQGKHL